MQKETLKTVDKIWGKEIWVVNNDNYCGKFLVLNKGAKSSYHYHPRKKETFMSIRGCAMLTIEDKGYLLTPFTRAKTILPGERHMFEGVTKAVIVEFSTHHDDSDVIRLTQSEASHEGIIAATTDELVSQPL